MQILHASWTGLVINRTLSLNILKWKDYSSCCVVLLLPYNCLTKHIENFKRLEADIKVLQVPKILFRIGLFVLTHIPNITAKYQGLRI